MSTNVICGHLHYNLERSERGKCNLWDWKCEKEKKCMYNTTELCLRAILKHYICQA